MKVRGQKKILHANRNQKKAAVAIFMSDNIDFKIETVGTSLVGQWLTLHFPCRGHGFDLWAGN